MRDNREIFKNQNRKQKNDSFSTPSPKPYSSLFSAPLTKFPYFSLIIPSLTPRLTSEGSGGAGPALRFPTQTNFKKIAFSVFSDKERNP